MKLYLFQMMVLTLMFGCEQINEWTKEEVLTLKQRDSDSGTGSDSERFDPSEVASNTVLNLTFESGESAGDKFSVSVPAIYDTERFDAQGCNLIIESLDETSTDSQIELKADSAFTSESDTGTDTLNNADDCELKHYADNNTVEWIGNQRALKIHIDAFDIEDNGKPRMEVQFDLDETQVDMSGEDYFVTFDIYLPSSTMEMGCTVIFGLYAQKNYCSIYSDPFYVSDADAWAHIHGLVKMGNAGVVGFSNFDASPGDWLVDALRIQVFCENAVNGDEVVVYLDNIIVASQGAGAGSTDSSF